MEKVLVELGELVAYRARYFTPERGGGGGGGADAAAAGAGAKEQEEQAAREEGSRRRTPPAAAARRRRSSRWGCLPGRTSASTPTSPTRRAASRPTPSAAADRDWVRERARAGAGAGGRAGWARAGGEGGDAGGSGAGGCGGACGGEGGGEEGAAAAAPASTSNSIEDIGGSASASPSLCAWHEGLEAAGGGAVLDPGVYTLADLRAVGRRRKWCPYFLARHMLAFANVIGGERKKEKRGERSEAQAHQKTKFS